jgi:hypothetical protein
MAIGAEEALKELGIGVEETLPRTAAREAIRAAVEMETTKETIRTATLGKQRISLAIAVARKVTTRRIRSVPTSDKRR